MGEGDPVPRHQRPVCRKSKVSNVNSLSVINLTLPACYHCDFKSIAKGLLILFHIKDPQFATRTVAYAISVGFIVL